MLNDRTASELITKSHHGKLSDEENELVQQHLQQSETTRAFAKLSRIIEDSVAQLAERIPDDPELAPGLGDDSKRRLKESIRLALSGQADQADDPLPESPASASVDTAFHYRRTRHAAGQLAAENPNSLDPDADETASRTAASRFTLIKKLGTGGLGTVWLARDESLGRNVAIKELNTESLTSQRAWLRFEREAEITGMLEHPNIVPLYLSGVDSRSGEPFYAMRFVGKRTLADAIIEYHVRRQNGVVEDDALELHRLLSVFLDVCQAVAYAHSRGVVHRDLKPENVALDNFGQVIVLDWGLAKLVDDGDIIGHMNHARLSDAELAQTVTGEVIGTPLYMAPEQAAGDLDRIDQRTDVYGLGAILFAILTGCAPHEKSSGSGDTTRSLKQVLDVIANNESPRPRDYCDNVPRPLAEICERAMARERALRFSSVSELADAVERWMAGQHQKKSRYEHLRMEGRELRADLQSTVRDLETNARFMSRLPPIHELIAATDEDKRNRWRERLATIYSGLLTANADYRSVVYSRVEGDQFTEIVRVERHATEHSNVRSVPRSRLRTERANEYLTAVVRQKPDDVVTALVCNPLCDTHAGCDDRVHLVAGVPVFDPSTEEPWGIVMIDCDIDRVMRRQLERRLSATEVLVACDRHATMMHWKRGQIIDESHGQAVAEIAPHFDPAVEKLQTHLEYLDESDSEIYGARLWLTPNRHGLMYLLRH